MERLLLLLFMGVLFFSCSDSSINKESKNTTQNMEQRSLTSMYTDLINSFYGAQNETYIEGWEKKASNLLIYKRLCKI